MRTLPLLLTVVGCLAVLTACSAPQDRSGQVPDEPASHTPSPDTSATEVPQLDTTAQRTGQTTIELTTFGSSSCPDEVTGVEALDAATIAVHLDNATDKQPCTMDYVPAHHSFEIPADVTAAQLTLQLQWANSPEVVTIPVDEP